MSSGPNRDTLLRRPGVRSLGFAQHRNEVADALVCSVSGLLPCYLVVWWSGDSIVGADLPHTEGEARAILKHGRVADLRALALPPEVLVCRTAGGECWMGCECVRDLPGLGPDVLLVPLPGHKHMGPRQQILNYYETTMLLLTDQSLAGSFTAVTLRLEGEGARWDRVPGGRSVPRRAVPLQAKMQARLDALDEQLAGTTRCVECNGPMESQGRRGRSWDGVVGPLALKRRYSYCEPCAKGRAPAQEALGLS